MRIRRSTPPAAAPTPAAKLRPARKARRRSVAPRPPQAPSQPTASAAQASTAQGIAPRKHAVFVPGFVAFDALGQLHYYAGVTAAFGRWQVLGDADRVCSVHYFDNFPTASVDMRAQRLAEYLLKRVARGEIAPRDELTLIGHSTGGLDVRRLLWCLSDPAARIRSIDAYGVPAARALRASIRRVVFISTPQLGTALADYIGHYRGSIQAWTRALSEGLAFNKPPLSTLRQLLRDKLGEPKSHLLSAVIDALEESDTSSARPSASPEASKSDRAYEREARAELAQWLEHMIEDFDAVDDLRSYSAALAGSSADGKSPAHFSPDERAEELRGWADLRTRSYATYVAADKAKISALERNAVALGRHTRLLELGQSVLGRLSERWYVPAVLDAPATALRAKLNVISLGGMLLLVNAWPELPFKLGYATCAAGASAFRDPAALGVPLAPHARRFDPARPAAQWPLVPRAALRRADNDGIVNTLSMFWPYDASDPSRHEVVLVHADHTDVIGHFERVRCKRKGDRVYEAYDLLESGALFSRDAFERLWHDIFSYAFAQPIAAAETAATAVHRRGRYLIARTSYAW